jgi:CRISPR system Cascade subunit CasA
MALGGRIAGSAESALAGPYATSVTFLLLGESVFETLVLNLLVYDGKLPIPSSPKDAPSWEQDIRAAGARAPLGHLDLLTWRPRRCRLVPEDSSGRTVKGVVPAGEASRLEAEEYRDPFAAYRVSETAGFLPLRIDPDRALWRDSLPFFAGDGEWGRVPLNVSQAASLVAQGDLDRSQLMRVLACGFATDKAKKRLGRIETIPIPAALLAAPGAVPLIRAALERAAEVDRAINSAAFVAARHALSTGERSPDTKDASSLAEATGARPVYWAEAGAAFPRFLSNLANERPDTEERWEQALREAARRAFDTVEIKLGADTRGLKAVTLGRSQLFRKLAEIFPTPQTPEEVTPHELV